MGKVALVPLPHDHHLVRVVSVSEDAETREETI